MQLTLVIPGLLDVATPALEAVDTNAPALTRLLSTAESPPVMRDGAIAIACEALGIARQSDWPVAPRLARAAGIDPANAYWLCAEPANMIISRDEVRLGSVVPDLDSDESTAIIATLNAHFANDGIALHAPSAARWYVESAEPQQMTTHEPDAALDAPLFAYLPAGPDAGRWRRWQSEMQMLLYEHPVNRAREAVARPVVNNVWIWGGGKEAPSTPRIRALFANVPWIVELFAASAVDVAPAPASYAELVALRPVSPALVWADVALDVELGSRLAALDRDWAAPVERALARREIEALELVLTGRETSAAFAPARATLAHRWRRLVLVPRLSALLAGYSTLS